MATFKLGKFKAKYDPETRGISYKWGDGDVHRVGGKTPSYEEDYAGSDDGYDYSYTDDRDSYSDQGDYAPDEEYADPSGYPYDDGSDSYDPDGYSYGGDDGYDPGYDDDNGGYGYEDGYGTDGGSGSGGSGFLSYVEQHPWVMYLLLVVFPPLGIWLLWKRGVFEQPIRLGISALSLIWFIVMIIWLISLFSGGGNEINPQGNYVIRTVAPTATPSADVTPAPTAVNEIANPQQTGGVILIDPDSGTNITPTATPVNNGMTQSGTYVYATTAGSYYHTNESCPLLNGATPSRATIAICTGRGQYECPYCYNLDVYYANTGGSYYHTKSSCGTMTSSEVYSLARAQAEGKSPCPTCAGGKTTTETAQSITTDKSGVTVYYTKNGRYFHTVNDCSGMKNASSGTLLSALKAGKGACPTCCPEAGTKVYCTSGGTYYHSYATCSDMKNASSMTMAQAMVLGKKRCPNCWTGTKGTTSAVGGYYVYATNNGTYYHTKSNCSGMVGASRVTLLKMIQANRKPCPVCCKGAGATVYIVDKGTYYHSYSTCSGLKNPKTSTLAYALAYGYKKCPKCWNSTKADTLAAADSSGTGVNNNVKDASGVYVYCTSTSKHYHTNSTCFGMKNASRVTLTAAVKAGKTACTTCCNNATKTVYTVSGGKYYHSDVTCNSLTNPKKGTIESALIAGYKPCPKCISSNANSGLGKDSFSEKSTYTSGTSGIKVYAVTGGKLYHRSKSCAGSEGKQITLETALNRGLSACDKCASDLKTSVYGTSKGKYYHKDKSCAGSGASKGTLAEALAYGLKACPNCVTGEKRTNYKSGTSGISVYVVKGGNYFHKDKSCAGTEATKTTLEKALNSGITKGCPKCYPGANETVYSTAGSKYYHHKKSCAGSGAYTITIAQAKAAGLKECQVCNASSDGDPGGSDTSGSGSTGGYASADTTVYVNLSGNSFLYHKNKTCAKGLEGVTLQFALDFGYKGCAKCNPPTKIH